MQTITLDPVTVASGVPVWLTTTIPRPVPLRRCALSGHGNRAAVGREPWYHPIDLPYLQLVYVPVGSALVGTPAVLHEICQIMSTYRFTPDLPGRYELMPGAWVESSVWRDWLNVHFAVDVVRP